jgi:hypothetical protein
MKDTEYYYVLVYPTPESKWKWDKEDFLNGNIGECDMKAFMCRGMKNVLKVMAKYDGATLLKSIDLGDLMMMDKVASE